MHLSGPTSNAWCPYKKRKQRHTDTGKTTCDDTGRDSGNVTAEGPPDRWLLTETRRETGTESPSDPPRRN